jgi:hypothetical protein
MIVTLLLAGKFLGAIKFLAYRLASWLGTGFFWKKGKDSGQKRFYWAAFLVWLASWALILYFSPKILRHTFHWVR